MRTFLVLLIFTNLGFLAWQQGWLFPGEPQAEVEAVPTFQQASQNLLLLTELPQEQLDAMVSLSQARLARSNAAQELATVQQEIATVESQIDEVQANIAEDQAQSIPPPVPWCAEAGAFGDRESAEAFVAPLSGLGASGTVMEREEPISSTWWVHMPAFSSEAAAMATLEELQSKDIDSYYMRSGEMAGGISMGVYSRHESALIGQQRLAGQGYATSIREVFRMGSRFYVTLSLPDGTLRETPDWADFLASAEGVEVTEKACEMIASENQFP